jgi:hypothetical protein
MPPLRRPPPRPVVAGAFVVSFLSVPLAGRMLRPAAEPPRTPAEFLDEWVFNLSSIVVLAEVGGKRMPLTGNVRGDDVLAGLKGAKLLKDGRCHVDLLKLPHYGSDRNVATEFFEQVTADHYVISADAKHGNPDPPTLRMLTEARGSDEYTIHLTNLPGPPHEGKKFLEQDRADNDRKYKVVVRDVAALSLKVELSDPLADRGPTVPGRLRALFLDKW